MMLQSARDDKEGTYKRQLSSSILYSDSTAFYVKGQGTLRNTSGERYTMLVSLRRVDTKGHAVVMARLIVPR